MRYTVAATAADYEKGRALWLAATAKLSKSTPRIKMPRVAEIEAIANKEFEDKFPSNETKRAVTGHGKIIDGKCFASHCVLRITNLSTTTIERCTTLLFELMKEKGDGTKEVSYFALLCVLCFHCCVLCFH